MTIAIIAVVVAVSLLVHIGLFLWIRAKVRSHDRIPDLGDDGKRG